LILAEAQELFAFLKQTFFFYISVFYKNSYLILAEAQELFAFLYQMFSFLYQFFTKTHI